MKQTELKKIAITSATKIRNSIDLGTFDTQPFRHLYIDDFFEDDLAKTLLNSFPSLNDKIWEKTEIEDIEIKYRTNFKSEFDIPEGLVDAFRILNSAEILDAIADVLEIPKLMPDPYYTGGGLNITEKGGMLDVHVDGNYHDASGLNRRVNVILYLNEGWQPDWGGEFGLYDETGKTLVKKIEPLFNRLMIFDTHDKSFHGLPDPLNFPAGNNRKSIILYYYTKAERPQENNIYKEPHSALWVKKNLKDKRGNTSREYY